MLDDVPLPARVLGLAGLLPFLAGALLVALAPDPRALPAVLGYGTIILSFMGGVHWGAAMKDRPAWVPLGCSVMPALAAWLGLLLPAPFPPIVLALAFAGLLAYDLRATRHGLVPAWYPSLRWPLTITVILCLAVVLLAG